MRPPRHREIGEDGDPLAHGKLLRQILIDGIQGISQIERAVVPVFGIGGVVSTIKSVCGKGDDPVSDRDVLQRAATVKCVFIDVFHRCGKGDRS